MIDAAGDYDQYWFNVLLICRDFKERTFPCGDALEYYTAYDFVGINSIDYPEAVQALITGKDSIMAEDALEAVLNGWAKIVVYDKYGRPREDREWFH